MAQNSDNVAVVRPKVDGAAWVGDSNTAVPTSAAAALTGFNGYGWIGEDGIVMTINNEVTDIKGFGGDTVVSIQDSHDVAFKYKPMEWNDVTVKEYFGPDATAESVAIKSVDLPVRPHVFDMHGRNNELLRVVVPKGKVVSLGDMPFKHNDYVASEITMKALPDANGVKVYIYKAAAAS